MLREVIPADLPIHFEQQRDPASVAMAVVPARDREAFHAHWQRLLADPTVVVRSVVADGEVVGSAVSFMRGGERQVGYWIGREHWGRGLASAALAELLTEITERPLFARVVPHNLRSLRVLEKSGFEMIGEERGDDGTLACVLRLD
jgi:RimJ/RimL family protein N-acetyltransferase